MKILVTGGCGYIGSQLVKSLLVDGHKVTVIDVMWYGQCLEETENLTIIRESVVDYKTTEKFDTVMHLAAVSNDPSVVEFPKLTWETNVLGTQNLLQNVVSDTFILASSGSVYGLSDKEFVSEHTSLVPMSDYNKSKMVAERVAYSYSNKKRIVALRPGTVCGRSSRMRFDVIGNMLAAFAAKGNLEVHGGTQIRPILPMIDMVRAYEFAMNSNVTGAFNVGLENLSVLDLAQKAMLLDDDITVSVKSLKDPRSYRLSSHRLKAVGFKFTSSIELSMANVFRMVKSGEIDDPTKSIFHNAKWMRENKHVQCDESTRGI